MNKLPFVSFLFALSLLSCNNSVDSTKDKEDQKITSDSKKETKEDCKCSEKDANSLAYKIISDFELSQNEVESQDALLISLYKLEKRPNCSWVATFKIYSIYNQLEHPDEYIQKRLMCDGVEIYTE